MIFDRPTAYELLDAVSIFLEGKIKNELPKHLGFNLQIAINVINIVKREIKSGKEIDETSSKLISDLLEDEDTMKSLACLLYTSPSPRDLSTSRMPSSA